MFYYLNFTFIAAVMLYCEMLSSKYVIVNKLVKSVTIYFMIEDIEQINTKVKCKIKQYRRHHYCPSYNTY